MTVPDEWTQANAAGRELTAYQNGDGAALARAVALVRAAEPSASDPDVLRLLSKVLLFGASETPSQATWEEAERVGRSAVDAAEPRHPALALALGTLATLKYEWFGVCHNRSAIEEAVALGLRAVEVGAEEYDDHLSIVQNLLVHTKTLADFGVPVPDRPLLVAETVLADLPARHPGWPPITAGYAVLLCEVAMRASSATGLDTAISRLRGVITGTGEPQRVLAGRRANLATMLGWRYLLGHEVRHLDEAVEEYREAQAQWPGQEIMTGLGETLMSRFARQPAQDDLDQALRTLRQAVAEEGAGRGRALAGLSSAMQEKHRLTGEPDHFFEAVDLARRAVGAADHPDLPERLVDLVVLLGSTSAASAVMAAEAVTEGRRAVAMLKDGDILLPRARSALGIALLGHHEHTREPRELGEAVNQLREAVKGTDPRDPAHALYRANLGLALHTRFTARGRRSDRRAALAEYREAAATAAEPEVRQTAARNQGYLAAETRRPAEAAAALAHAVRLQAQAVPERLARSDVQRLLVGTGDLAEDAAAMAVVRYQDDRAAGLLELGRGVLLNRTLSLRTDLGAVRQVSAELAGAFERASDHVEATALSGKVEERARALAGYRDVLEEIRAQPGLRRFLAPPRTAELTRTARQGPVVLVNVSSYRCDALVLLRDGVACIPLPRLNLHEVREQVRSVCSGVPADADLVGTLDWLWHAVAGPVLTRLAPVLNVGDRLWWVPTGVLSLLPLHAATSARTGESALDRVVSSYAPTASAIRHARRPGTSSSLPMVISARYADDPLPRSVQEAAEVAARWGTSPLDATDLPGAEVLSALASAGRAHIALHAVSDPLDPSASRLLLPHGQVDVTDVLRMKLGDSAFCYLSACETSSTTTELANEAIHLTSAFFLAGFRSVVGTFWPMGDVVSGRAAVRFHDQIGPAPAAADIALAVHRSALDLRRRYPRAPRAWAALQHVGA
ncbi:CHAT domain-containing protein [Lentzea alba]|uniref:CHAT domain-containing protein n=1 Tax=Lentzea alba TaxID=2714351 RepID=UPI0039BFE75B